MNRRIITALVAGLALAVLWVADRAPRLAARTPAQSAATADPSVIAHPSLPAADDDLSAGIQSREIPPASRVVASEPLRPADPAAEAEFAAFDDWLANYLRTRDSESAAVADTRVGLGLTLAQARRNQMEDLIEADPKRAIELAVGEATRAQLPEALRRLVEVRVRGRGDLDVLAALPEPGGEAAGGPPTWREATLDGTRYRAFVYGRRLGDPTLRGIPLLGVALDGRLAVADALTLRLNERDARVTLAAAPLAACAVCDTSLPPETASPSALALETPRGVSFACGETHASALTADLETEAEAQRAAGLASAGTTGLKKLILIRVDFSDLAGAPFTDAQGTDLVTGTHDFYWESSYQRSGFRLVGEGSAITPTYRMLKTAAYYGSTDAAELRTAARNAARADGFLLSAYEYDLICIGRVPGFGWSGLGYVGAPGSWIRASFDGPGVSAHELGHNFGLPHANFWDTAGESVIGAGTSVEYGDSFDTMGSASARKRHFNARFKNLINWLPAAGVATFTTNGVYRIHAHDLATAAGVRGLKIRKSAGTNYWVEFRQKFTDNAWALNGVGLRWSGNGGEATRLLDVTPGSPDGKNDSLLVIGRTFSDAAAGLHFTPLAKGDDGTPFVDVAVNQGAYTNLAPPTLVLSASQTNVAPGATVTVAAAATEPQAGELAYHWDFGDATLGENRPTAAHSWNAAGHYRVRCTVSNLKGGTATASALIRVGSPTTVTLAGRVQRDGLPLADVRVSLSDGKVGYTDSDGRYVITGVARGSVALKASREGFVFSHPTFANPLNITGNRAGLDFEADLPGDLELITLVPAGARWRFLDDGSNRGTAWRESGFADAAWEEGNARFGYGDNGIVTPVSFGADPNNKFITTYFRRAFDVAAPGELAAVTLGLVRDDGAVVYLNGKEVFRSNLPTGTIGYRTAASSAVGGAEESTYFESDLDPTALRAGRNVLAVEVHQSSGTSSDIAFDLRLTGIKLPAAVPTRLSAEAAHGRLRLTWPVNGTAWTVETSDTADPQWRQVAGDPARDGNRWLLTVPIEGGVRFYRLMTR